MLCLMCAVFSIFNIHLNLNSLQAVCRQKADIDCTDGEKLDFRHTKNKPGRSSEAFRRRSVSDPWTFIKQRSKHNTAV